MLAQDRRLTLRLIAEELGISKDTANTIVRDDLDKRMICSWFVPQKLTDEQRAKRMETSLPCVTRIHCFWKTSSREMRPGATSSIRNKNGNWWRSVHRLPRDQKSRLQKSKVKTCWSAFFNRKGIIHKEFVPAGQTINAAFLPDSFEPIATAYPAGSARVAQDWKIDAALR